MHPREKDEALSSIAQRAATAERAGLTATAKSWRDLYCNVNARSAAAIIVAAKPLDPIGEPPR